MCKSSIALHASCFSLCHNLTTMVLWVMCWGVKTASQYRPVVFLHKHSTFMFFWPCVLNFVSTHILNEVGLLSHLLSNAYFSYNHGNQTIMLLLARTVLVLSCNDTTLIHVSRPLLSSHPNRFKTIWSHYINPKPKQWINTITWG